MVCNSVEVQRIVSELQVCDRSGKKRCGIYDLHRCKFEEIGLRQTPCEGITQRGLSTFRCPNDNNFLDGHQSDNLTTNLLRDLNKDLVVFDHSQITASLFFDDFQAFAQVIDFRRKTVVGE